MNKIESISIISKYITDEPIISANGFLSRDLFTLFDKDSNFYMIGSMGLASSIGLGIAISNPKKKVYVFDGDGNILMNLGSLTTIGTLKPKNLVHVIFDNEIHESTGGQPTNSKLIQIDKICKTTNYCTFNVKNKFQLESVCKKIKKINGPILVLIKIHTDKHCSGRVKLTPIEIKKRFMHSLNLNLKSTNTMKHS